MVEDVKQILSMDISEVIASEVSLKLIGCASKLYFNGRSIGFCAASQREYYNLLKQNGISLAKKYDMVMKRTCVPTRDGITDRKGVGMINWQNVDDEEATSMLMDGYFKEEDFEKLPDMYLEMRGETAPEAIEEAYEETETAPEGKKRGRKPNK